MAEGFNRNEVAALLAKCHRRCCICHRFCGTKIETDHMDPAANSKNHSIENAIPVCFECHADIHAYNPNHPRGRKFTLEELRQHKKQWLDICDSRPDIFVSASHNVDIGPVQGLLDELDHNLVISTNLDHRKLGFLFKDEQLNRAIREGVLSTLDDQLRQAISSAYGAVSRANEFIRKHHGQSQMAEITFDAVRNVVPLIQDARNRLLEFVSSEAPCS